MITQYNTNLAVCVLGGTGFIGIHLITELFRQSNITAYTLTRHPDKAAGFPDHVQTVVGNLIDRQTIENFIVPGSTVVNLAFSGGADTNDNFKITRNLAAACNKANVKRLIHVSTATVVGRSKSDIVSEETTCRPVSAYEQTKLKIENILLEEIAAPCETVIVRPTAVFGPEGKNLLKLAEQVLVDTRLKKILKTAIMGDRSLNLVCVENVVAAIRFLIQFNENLSGQCFYISDDDDRQNNYRDTSTLLAQHFGLIPVRDFQLPFQELFLAFLIRLIRGANTNPKRQYNAGKLARLGCPKAISFTEGIAQFAAWYLNQRDRL